MPVQRTDYGDTTPWTTFALSTDRAQQGSCTPYVLIVALLPLLARFAIRSQHHFKTESTPIRPCAFSKRVLSASFLSPPAHTRFQKRGMGAPSYLRSVI